MGEREALGQVEEALLLAIHRLGEDEAFGLALHHELEDRLERRVAAGAVYVTLERLEKKGLVSSTEQKALSGRRRRCYRLETPGAEALNRSRETAEKIWFGVSWPVGASR